jgi:hypothetical protein
LYLYYGKQLFLLIPLLALIAIIYILVTGVNASNQNIFGLSATCIGIFLLIMIGINIDIWYIRPMLLNKLINKIKGMTGMQAVPELIAYLADSRPKVRRAASDRLSIIDVDVTPALIQTLYDSPYDSARSAAADALGEKLDRTALSSLQIALEREKSTYVRKAISQAIKNLEQYGKL